MFENFLKIPQEKPREDREGDNRTPLIPEEKPREERTSESAVPQSTPLLKQEDPKEYKPQNPTFLTEEDSFQK